MNMLWSIKQKRSAWIKILEQSDKKDLLILIQKMADISSESENLLIEYCKQKADTHQKELLYERQLQIKWNSIDSIIDDANSNSTGILQRKIRKKISGKISDRML